MFRSRLMTVLAATGIATVLAVVVTVALAASDLLGVVSLNGLIALGLGITGTLVLTALLMVAVFHSSRAGYDERASRSEE
jgi:hypothetical protein